VLRTLELVDPERVYGRPWRFLTRDEQFELLGYASLRFAEESGSFEKEDKD
jgi:hypothetical protein